MYRLVVENREIYIGQRVAMSKAATFFEDKCVVKGIRKWRRKTRNFKQYRAQNKAAVNLYRVHMEKRIVCRWKLYVKYAKRYRKCLKRTKQWYLHRLVKQYWNKWNRQYLYYSELHSQSHRHFERRHKRKVLKEWRKALIVNKKINQLKRKQYFSKWEMTVQRNRIPILSKATQINAICNWMQHSFNCNVIDVVCKINSNEHNKINKAQQVMLKMQNEYKLVWKSTRINQLNQMIAIHQKYYGVILHFKKWKVSTQNMKQMKLRHFRAWRYIIIHWKHQQIVANKYERRNLLRNAFEVNFHFVFLEFLL